MVIALPVAMALIYEYYILTNAEHRVHIVGIDDGGYAIFMGYVAKERINKQRSLRIKTGVGLIAE